MGTRHLWMVVAAACAAWAMAPSTNASATVIDLADGNASMRFDTGAMALASSWEVDGVNHLAAMGLWLSVNSAPQVNVGDIDATPTVAVSNTNFDARADRVSITWTGVGVEVFGRFTLRGTSPGSGGATLSEILSITNTSAVTATYRLFEYADFDVMDTAGDDTAVMTGLTRARQTDATGSVIEMASVPNPTTYEIGLTTDSPSLWDRLNGGTLVSLGSQGGPVTGDAAWAFAWDVTLAPGQTYLVSKVASVSAVPEPASLALAGIGCLLIVRRKRSS